MWNNFIVSYIENVVVRSKCIILKLKRIIDMKKRILYTVLLAAGLTFSGCSDQFLQDMNPYDSYSPEKTFGIESNLDLYIQNVYYNYFYKSGMTPPQSYGLSGSWNDYSTYTEEKWGTLGLHASVIQFDGLDFDNEHGVTVGINYRFNRTEDDFWNKALNGLNLMGEYYDSVWNVGTNYSVWKDRINVVAALYDGRFLSVGIYFRVCLK